VVTIYFSLNAGYLPFYQPYIHSTISLLLSFGLFMITYSYMFSFAFSNSMSAFKTFPVVNFLIAYTVPLVVCDFFITSPLAKSLSVMLSPFYALDQGLK
jgi:hypothetical protein